MSGGHSLDSRPNIKRLLALSNTWTAAQTLNDDIALQIGTGGTVSLIYETADANANALFFVAPEGGATDVPVFVFGDASILNSDLGWFNGVVEPRIAVVDDDKDSYIALGFASDDAAQIILGGSAALTLPALTLGGAVAGGDQSFTNVGDMTFAAGSILASGSTNGNTLLLRANDTTFITLTTGATDAMTVGAFTLSGNITMSASETVDGVDVSAHAVDYDLHTVVVRKTADETVNNSDTLQNDDHLLYAIGANEVWAFEVWVYFNAGTTPDFKWGFTAPSGAAGRYKSSNQESNAATFTQFVTAAGTGSDALATGNGIIVNGSNAGNLQFQWAQNTATVEDTKVLANSILRLTKVA